MCSALFIIILIICFRRRCESQKIKIKNRKTLVPHVCVIPLLWGDSIMHDFFFVYSQFFCLHRDSIHVIHNYIFKYERIIDPRKSVCCVYFYTEVVNIVQAFLLLPSTFLKEKIFDKTYNCATLNEASGNYLYIIKYLCLLILKPKIVLPNLLKNTMNWNAINNKRR